MNAHILTMAGLFSALLLSGTSIPAVAQDTARDAQPAEMMPLASKVIINDLARVGGGFIAVGERGHILRSSDGSDWQQVPSPTRAMLTRVTFVDADHGWAVGHDGSVLHTRDGGAEWELRHYDADWGKPFYDASFTSPESGLVVGANGRMMRTDDGGENWVDVSSPVFDTGFHLYDLSRLPGEVLLIAGERGFLARSLDGGDSWEMIVPPYIGSYFGVLPVGEAGALFYGLQGRVYLAPDVAALEVFDDPLIYDPFINETVDDPGQLRRMGWQRFENADTQSLFGAAIGGDDNAHVILVGVDGTMLHGRLDSGRVSPLSSPTSEPISDVLIASDRLLLGSRTGMHYRDLPDELR